MQQLPAEVCLIKGRMMEEITFEEIKRLQAGDRDVFNRIIAIYRKRVISLCSKYMRNAEEAKDAAQEAFCAAYTGIKGFEFKSKFSTWMYRLTVNRCINRLNSLKRRDAMHAGRAEEAARSYEENFLKDGGRLPDEEMEQKEFGLLVLKELERFSREDRAIILLHDMEGLSWDEISVIMGMPAGSARSAASRARHRLKKILERKARQADEKKRG